jgi:hypothetical protein
LLNEFNRFTTNRRCDISHDDKDQTPQELAGELSTKAVEELIALKTRIMLKGLEWLTKRSSPTLIAISLVFYGIHAVIDFLAHASHYVLPVIGPVSVFVVDHIVLRGYDDGFVAIALFCDAIVMLRIGLRLYYWMFGTE